MRAVPRFLDSPDDAGPGVALDGGIERLAGDDLSEAWVQRIRREKQRGWRHAGW